MRRSAAGHQQGDPRTALAGQGWLHGCAVEAQQQRPTVEAPPPMKCSRPLLLLRSRCTAQAARRPTTRLHLRVLPCAPCAALSSSSTGEGVGSDPIVLDISVRPPPASAPAPAKAQSGRGSSGSSSDDGGGGGRAAGGGADAAERSSYRLGYHDVGGSPSYAGPVLPEGEASSDRVHAHWEKRIHALCGVLVRL
eukprot:COSAG01_NODE_227_length_21107_cov_85.615099_14_plen_194_part_00